MAQFFGTVKGTRGQCSRLGSKSSGLDTVAASWRGAIRTELSSREGRDRYRVVLLDWPSRNVKQVLAEGYFDEMTAPSFT